MPALGLHLRLGKSVLVLRGVLPTEFSILQANLTGALNATECKFHYGSMTVIPRVIGKFSSQYSKFWWDSFQFEKKRYQENLRFPTSSQKEKMCL